MFQLIATNQEKIESERTPTWRKQHGNQWFSTKDGSLE